MPYATLEDLIDRAGATEILQVADRDKDGTPDPAVIDKALTDADNTINGYVSAKYTLPLAEIPGLFRTWAVSIARHTLHRNTPPANVIYDLEAAIDQLKDVAAGRMSLPMPSGEQPAVASGTFLGYAPDEVFNSFMLRGW